MAATVINWVAGGFDRDLDGIVEAGNRVGIFLELFSECVTVDSPFAFPLGT